VMKRSKKHEAGYTLTEMLVVLLLLSLITAIGPVAIQKLLPSLAVNSAAKTLSADLETLRIRAMMSGSEGRLQVDPNGVQYELLIGGEAIRQRDLASSVRVSAQNYEEDGEQHLLVLASADGRLSGAPLVLRRGNKTKYIEINSVFGTAQIAK